MLGKPAQITILTVKVNADKKNAVFPFILLTSTPKQTKAYINDNTYKAQLIPTKFLPKIVMSLTRKLITMNF